MRRETVLAGGVAVVLVATALFLAFVPGAIDPPEVREDPEPTGRLSIEEVTIAPGQVSGASATLQVDTRIRHRGNAVDNATLEVRAISLESGLVRTSQRIPVESITANGETRVGADLSVPRSGGYRIETILYQDGRRVHEGSKEVRGVGSLTPAYADDPVDFHRFRGPGVEDFRPIEYAIAGVEDERVTMDVTAFLTNNGDRATDDLRVEFAARQADSNIVTDETTVEVGTVAPGATVRPSGQLTVPDGYNYYLEAQVWKGDTLLTTARSAANLNPSPNESISVREDPDDEGGLEVGEFESDREPEADDQADEDAVREETVADGAGGPGFGAGVAVLALLALALIGRRYHD